MVGAKPHVTLKVSSIKAFGMIFARVEWTCFQNLPTEMARCFSVRDILIGATRPTEKGNLTIAIR